MATKLSSFLSSSFAGSTGPSGTIEIGTVTTAEAGTPASVTNSGTQTTAILNFILPKGDPSDMIFPGAGIPVSTGTAWSPSLTAPSGTIVGTTDTQTLTNKTLTSPTINSGSLTTVTLTNPTISGTITFSNGSTQSSAGVTTGKSIAMAMIFGL